MKNIDEIKEQIGIAMESNFDSKFPFETYEDGVIAALRWVLGEATLPMDDGSGN